MLHLLRSSCLELMAPKVRRTQPDAITAEQVAQVFKDTAPSNRRAAATKNGALLTFKPTKKGGLIDRSGIEEWQDTIWNLLKMNPSGIYNVTMFEDALKIFDESMGFPMTDESHDVIKHESYNGEHMSKQAMILNKYLQGVQRIKSNTTTGTRHPKWLNKLIAALDAGAVLSASDISYTQ